MTEVPPPPPPPPSGPAAQPAPLSESDERLWATIGHVGIIVLGILSPLIVWLMFKERSEFVDDQAKEALNFSILGTIITIVTCGFGWIVVIIFAIIAGIAANKGERYRYPLNWRIIK